MSNLNNVIDQVLQSPQLRNCIQNCLNVQVTTSSVATANAQPTAVPAAGSSTNSMREELRRLFPSIQPSYGPTPSAVREINNRRNKRKRGTEKKPFLKEILLLKTPSERKTLKGLQKAKSYDEGFGLSAVQFEKHWSYTEVINNIKQLFQDKLQGSEFEILVPMSGYLVQPNLRNEQELDGETLAKIFYNKVIYIRPTEPFACTSGDEDNCCELKEFNNNEMDCKNHEKQEEKSTVTDATVVELELDNPMNFESYPLVSEPKSLQEILVKLTENMDEENVTYFNVYREDIFNCCLRALRRRSFLPNSKVNVVFTDSDNTTEGAVDAGGPKREMFRLLLNHFKTNSCLFAGPSNNKFITLDKEALDNRLYYEAGRIFALAIVHAGIGLRFFSELFFTLLSQGPEQIEPTISDVTNSEVRVEIEKAINAPDLQELRNVVLEGTYIRLAGWEIINDFGKKDSLVADVIKFYTLERCLKSVSQFQEGLSILGVFDYVKKYPEYFIDLMCYTRESILTLTKLEALFTIKYSEEGSNRRNVESRITAFWKDFLLDCDENEDNSDDMCSLEEILIFCTGVNIIPALGFDTDPSIQFLHDDISLYPRGNTCSLEMHLPTIHIDYEKFKYYMVYGIKNGMVFGFA